VASTSPSQRIGIAGVRVGHWTDEQARTGCTVVVVPPATIGAGEIRGGAPATREFGLLDPTTLVDTVDAVVLAGGSAFGLAAADGVMAALEDQGRGFPTRHGAVPIVPAMALYDLGVGDATVRPDAAAGRAAFAAADTEVAMGSVGAGTGARVGKWRGPDAARDGGLGIATVERCGATVTAVVAVNAAGDVDTGAGWSPGDRVAGDDRSGVDPFGNTTIGVVVTDAALDANGCLVLAQGGHDGLARSVMPPHMRSDGDAFVALATGTVALAGDGDEATAGNGDEATAGPSVDDVRLAAVMAVERAVRASVATIER